MRSDKRKAESELVVFPDPPAARRKDDAPVKFTGLGIAARVCAVLAFICMFLPWLGVPAFATISQYSAQFGPFAPTVMWSYGLPFLPPGDYIYPMFATGDVAGFLDGLTGTGMYGPVWAVFFMGWIAGAGLLAVRFVQSLTRYRETKRLVLAGFVAGIVAAAWVVAVFVLNGLYANDFSRMFGMQMTVFEAPLSVYAAAAFGIATGVCARKSKR